MKPTTTLKVITAIACFVAIFMTLHAYNNNKHYQQLIEIKEEYEFAKTKFKKTESELREMKERQNSIHQIKQEYVKNVREANKALDAEMQNPLEESIEFDDVYKGLASLINSLSGFADKYCSNYGGHEEYLSFIGCCNLRNLLLLKLRVVMYESLCYKDAIYIPLYRDSFTELINENKCTYCQ